MSKLCRNAAKAVFASALSPAKNTSRGLSSATMWRKIELKAFTTCALVGAAAAICCDTELPSVVTSPLASALNGLVMSTRILPASASP